MDSMRSVGSKVSACTKFGPYPSAPGGDVEESTEGGVVVHAGVAAAARPAATAGVLVAVPWCFSCSSVYDSANPSAGHSRLRSSSKSCCFPFGGSSPPRVESKSWCSLESWTSSNSGGSLGGAGRATPSATLLLSGDVVTSTPGATEVERQ